MAKFSGHCRARKKKKLEFQLTLGTGTCTVALKFACPGQVLLCSFNDFHVSGRRLAQSLAHQASENEKLLA